MYIFLDTTDIALIEKYYEIGLVDGVTTNPTLIARSGRKQVDVIRDICEIVNTSVSVEMIGQTAKEMLSEAKQYINLGPQITIKLPCNPEGFKACRQLADESVNVNMTLCFSLEQALVALKAGAFIVSPFIGRMEDSGLDGIGLAKDIEELYVRHTKPDHVGPLVLAASIRNIAHIRQLTLAGIRAMTIPAHLIEEMMHNEMTTIGQEKFLQDFRDSKEGIPLKDSSKIYTE